MTEREGIESQLINGGLEERFLKDCLKIFYSSKTDSTVYLIGTAHVSSKSAQDVKRIVELVKPDVIVVELCQSRIGLLMDSQNDFSTPHKDDSTMLEDLKKEVSKRGGLSGVLYVLLSSMYKKISKQLKVSPGIEFKAAFDAGKGLGAKIILGDRPIEITLKRSWAMLSFWEKTTIIWHLLKDSSLDISEDDIEKLKNSDLITELMGEFTQEFPSLAQTIIHERDVFLTNVLRSANGRTVVGVVGLGHLKGIEENWEKDLPSNASLCEIPNRSSYVWNTIKYSAVLTAVFGIGFTVAKQINRRFLSS